MKFFNLTINPNKFLTLTVTALSLIGLTAAVKPTQAASAYVVLEANQVLVGDTAIADVFLKTDKENINVVEGDVRIKETSGKITVKDLSIAGSDLAIWPNTPSLATDSSQVSFVGGTPGGLNKDTAKLFRIVFTAETPGQVSLEPENFQAYINDGAGTKTTVTSKPLVIEVKAKPETVAPTNAWQQTIAQDNTPPQNLTVTFGQDPSMFDNQKFIFIAAVDSQSGLDHFEVKEGNWPLVRSGNTYALRDQTGKSDILVLAYDKAGNSSRILVRPVNYHQNIIMIGVGIILLLVIISYICLRLARKKKHG